MKTITTSDPQTTPEETLDRMRELSEKIRGLREDNSKLNAEYTEAANRIRMVVFAARDQGRNYSTPLEKVIESYHRLLARESRGDRAPRNEIAHDESIIGVLGPKIADVQKALQECEGELRELVKMHGSKRDANLLSVHRQVVDSIAEALKPFAEEKEAKAVALGLDLPTGIHLRIGAWNRGSSFDVLNSARNIIQELEAPLPEAVSNK